MKNTVHLVLQGKGGVGKSLSASILAQYFLKKGHIPSCADTDPVNNTFHQIKGLNAALVEIAENGVVIQRLFDPLFESILMSEEPVVVDNGASTFLPMVAFIKSNEILDLLQESGKQVYIHTIITGGQAKDDTLAGLFELAKLIKASGSGAKIIIWKNEFWGEPLIDGSPLEKSAFIENLADLIKGFVPIIDRHSDAFTTDLRIMSERHMTCDEVRQSEDFGLLAKSRVHRVFNDIYRELDAVFIGTDNKND